MLRPALIAALALILTLLLVYSAFSTPTKISPQGCRMSYMSPSYVLQTGFNASWTSASLASRYRLVLYREVGWDLNDELRGVPVVFIPGNAGSAHQVRSIASSASRQYFSSPSNIDSTFASRNLKPLDVFAVDFNEDLSAFHGPTLASQRQYSANAVSYILSLYPSDTQIIVTGHSMGGIVATDLLPSRHIKAIITMSTPHSVPPARFDSRMDLIYHDVRRRLIDDSTPILSICGGVTDTMIPSEFCALPPVRDEESGFRKTIFTSSLEGCWSGVGHREMVWCHQVRWRVARALLELGGSQNVEQSASILNDYFRDGIHLTALNYSNSGSIASTMQDHNLATSVDVFPLVVQGFRGSRSYALEIKEDVSAQRLVVYVSKGTILSVSPANPSLMMATIRLCRRETFVDSSDSTNHLNPVCNAIQPLTLRLIPNPNINYPFPVPHAGVDESDGVVVFEAQLQSKNDDNVVNEWVSIDLHSETTQGWAVASVESVEKIVNNARTHALLFNSIEIPLNPKALYTDIEFPNLLSNVLVVYRSRATPSRPCETSLLPPLLSHTAGPVEGHFHRLAGEGRILLHGHSSAPFLSSPKRASGGYSFGLNLTIFSSGECGIESLTITVDWWNSFGRWGARYWNAILSWSVGVICFLFYSSWSAWDRGDPMPTPSQALNSLVHVLPRALVTFIVISFIPLPSAFWLGNVGEPIFAPLAAFLLFISCGLVLLSWFGLSLILTAYGKVIWLASRCRSSPSTTRVVSDRSRRKADQTPKDHLSSIRDGLLTILFMSLMVFLFVPWQVAFLACYLMHLHHCAVLLQPVNDDHADATTCNQKLLVLLAMTWCLPVVAPVLAVWVRTLATAGLTTPSDGDHVVINSLSFVALTYAMVTMRGPVFRRRHRRELISVPMLYALGAVVAFFVGPRSAYRMYEALNWPTFGLLCFRVVPQFLRGVKCSTTTSISDVREI